MSENTPEVLPEMAPEPHPPIDINHLHDHIHLLEDRVNQAVDGINQIGAMMNAVMQVIQSFSQQMEKGGVSGMLGSLLGRGGNNG